TAYTGGRCALQQDAVSTPINSETSRPHPPHPPRRCVITILKKHQGKKLAGITILKQHQGEKLAPGGDPSATPTPQPRVEVPSVAADLPTSIKQRA
ncbi:hypothetical protein OC834_005164, partial [Tilletia horrida]